MINSVALTGRLTRDPDLRYTGSGTSVANFTLAVNRLFKTEGQPEADFISCVAWRKTAEILSQYTSKGSLIGVEGRLQTRTYDDKDGKTVYVTEVVVERLTLMQTKSEQQSSYEPPEQNNYYSPNISDEELPF